MPTLQADKPQQARTATRGDISITHLSCTLRRSQKTAPWCSLASNRSEAESSRGAQPHGKAKPAQQCQTRNQEPAGFGRN